MVRYGSPSNYAEIEFKAGDVAIFVDHDPKDEYAGHGSKVGPNGVKRTLIITNRNPFEEDED